MFSAADSKIASTLNKNIACVASHTTHTLFRFIFTRREIDCGDHLIKLKPKSQPCRVQTLKLPGTYDEKDAQTLKKFVLDREPLISKIYWLSPKCPCNDDFFKCGDECREKYKILMTRIRTY